MDHGLNDKTTSTADPNHAGLPLAPAFPEHPGASGFGVGSFGVDAGGMIAD